MKKRFLSLVLVLTVLISSLNGLFVSGADNTNSVESKDFIVKENIETYVSNNEIQGFWKSNSTSLISLSLEEDTLRVYRENGKSLKCSYDLTDNNYFAVYYNNKILNDDLNGNNLGFDSRLGFWIYTDNDISLYLSALDSKLGGTEMQTDSITLTSGEHFVYFDWTDFKLRNTNTLVLDYIYDLKFVITSETKTGNVWIDQIGLKVLGTGEITHGEAFYEVAAGDHWKNQNTETTTLNYANSDYYYKGETNLQNDGTSLKVDYKNITNQTISKFYYNADFRINKKAYTQGAISENLYGEDTVLTLWIKTDKPIVLELQYSDKTLQNTTLYSNWYKTTLKRGENILKIPLKDLVVNKNSAYYWVYQLLFKLYSPDETAISGSIYIDAIGFYNNDTDNELSEKINNIGEVSPENSEQIWDMIYYYNELSENEKKSITSETLYDYNKIVNRLMQSAPQIIFADTYKNSEEFEDGTLNFDVEIDNAFGGLYTVEEIGAVVHRKALVDRPHRVDQYTENCVSASQEVNTQSNYYRKNIVLKCFDGYEKADFEGYLRTTYIVRPFITYKNNEGNIFTVYGEVYDTSSNQILAEDENVNNAIDNNIETAWEVSSAGKYSLYFDFGNPKTFNSVDFAEKSQGEYNYTNANGELVKTQTQIYGITDFDLWISDDKINWKKIYTQDEMGNRTIILDDTYTASFVKLDVTTDMAAGIIEADFKTTEKFNKKLRVVSYVRMTEDITEYGDNIKSLTDIILIDYGDWNQKGEFIFTDNNGDGGVASENVLRDRIAQIKLINPDINIWFSLRRVALAENELKTDVFSETTDNEALINTCLELCSEYGLKGIDFDFEYPENATQLNNYNDFLVDLGKALHNSGFMLSVATSDYVNHNKSAAYIDYVNLMTYDRISLDRFGKHNTVNAISRQIDKIISNGFTKEQINLGLGYYGKELGGYGSTTYKALVRSYYDTAVNGNNVYGNKYYCAGSSLVADKVVYALQQDLCGVFSWSLTTDLPLSHEFSLAGAVEKTIERFTTAD